MKLRVITLFSGYDSQCMGLDRLKEKHPDFDYELVAWSEIDKYAIQAHNAIYPQWSDRNLGDVSKIDWDKAPDCDLITYSFPCVTKDSLILTIDGYKQIQNINIGDYVLTRTGYYEQVVKKFDNGVHPTCYVDALGCENIHCTYNHKFLVRTMHRVWDNPNRTYKRVFDEPVYKELKDMKKGDYLGMPICEDFQSMPVWKGVEDNRWGHHKNSNKISSIMEEECFWYLMGRYVGDGWKAGSKRFGKGIIVCCGGRNEQLLIDAIQECGYNFTLTIDRTVKRYHISSNELNEFVDRFGYKAYGKHIDGETMRLPLNLLESFVKGCMDSDGCFTQGRHKFSTISRELAYGFAFCVGRVFGVHCSIHMTKRKPKVVIEGRTCNQHNSYEVVFDTQHHKQDQAFCEDGYIWYPFYKTIPAEDENVYNIEVENEHSYILQGCISKNCTDISNAGVQKGFGEGSGTRSSLLWECRKAIIAKKPKYLLMENVAALMSQKFLPGIQKWFAELESYGYRNWGQVLNAKDYGVPQNRERIFLVSILGGGSFEFPKPIKLTKKLKDILEDKVDESYYLDDSKVQAMIAHCDKKQLEGCGFKFEPTEGEGAARTITSKSGSRETDNYVKTK